eukprot:TRINITY_DN2480_c0_g1_i7.p4 TRINITY_DN2480_c0_g1~~TRINITY_DN2480_c0_g1_i7.p4  ORF type:complete len:156 (-),score=40.92 TRINITY_DN2480_c0_g1_i7:1043-1510(-)
MGVAALGLTFVKLGHLLALRPNVLPPACFAELSPLQDDVAPFPADVARRTVCEELGVASLDEVFVELEEAPVAALSLAQVCHFGVAPAVSRLYRLEVAADGTLAAGAARGWWGKEGGEGGGEATACTLARSHAKTQFKRKRAWQRLKFYWRHRSL